MISKLFTELQLTGTLPTVEIAVSPLGGGLSRSVTRFLEYSFSSSILVPVDAFSFTFAAPEDIKPVTQYFTEGDIISIIANGQQVSCGIIDSVEIDVDAERGERITLSGRDLMGQLADQHCVTPACQPIWGNDYTVEGAVRELIKPTRIAGLNLKDAPSQPYFLATEPNETRLNALLRFLEPLNCVAWMAPDGKINVGRPTFTGAPVGTIICNKKNRESNVLNISCSRSATQTPGVISALWSDAQNTQVDLPKEQIFTNDDPNVKKLMSAGHQVYHTVVSSIPRGATPEDFRSSNELRVATSRAKTLLNYLVDREFARANTNVLQVRAQVPGHFNDLGQPFAPDTLYQIDFDRAGINQIMYCYAVEWSLSPSGGQTSILSFCQLNTIVGNTRAI